MANMIFPEWVVARLFKEAWSNPHRSRVFTISIWVLGLIFLSFIVVPIILAGLGIV